MNSNFPNYAERMDNLNASAIREILKLAAGGNIISFAGGLPSPESFPLEDIKKAISIINDYVFEDPLPESEIATICRDEAFKPDDVIQEQIEKAQEKKSSFSHIDIAESIIAGHNLIGEAIDMQ